MNQLQGSQRDQLSELSRDLQAIRMASVNPILDPWVYILLRKTVVLKLMEKIKCLFCKMGGRRRGEGAHFGCTDEGHLSFSVISRDCPSLMSHELQDLMNTSQTFLLQTVGHLKRASQVGPAQDEAACCGFGRGGCEGAAVARSHKDSSTHVAFTEQITNTQEKSEQTGGGRLNAPPSCVS